MGKAQLRPGKASKGKAQEEEDDFDNSQSDSLLAGLLADQTSLLALFVLVAVIVIIGLMLWVNHSASIQSYVAKHGLQEVISIDSSFDMPSKNSKDKDDLLETYAAVDALERAVQHGNIAGARLILHQLVSSKSVTEENVLALAKLIDDAEAENPIVDIGECVATEAMDLVLEKGGRFVTRDDEGKDSKRPGIMMADFDHDKETADGRGRGIASLNVLKEGDFIMEIPQGAMMTALNAQASPALARVFKEQKQLKPFQQLAVYLLHEAGKKARRPAPQAPSPDTTIETVVKAVKKPLPGAGAHRPPLAPCQDSVHRKHICSMPLHIPLPFLWQARPASPRPAARAQPRRAARAGRRRRPTSPSPRPRPRLRLRTSGGGGESPTTSIIATIATVSATAATQPPHTPLSDLSVSAC
jgi:hypothetical protein